MSNKIVVATLYRLGKDGDSFSKTFKTEVRSKAKVNEDYVITINANWKTSGQMYVIDEKATKERDEVVYLASLTPEQRDEIKRLADDKETKAKEVAAAKERRDKLLIYAKELKLEFAKNISLDKLQRMVNDATQGDGSKSTTLEDKKE